MKIKLENLRIYSFHGLDHVEQKLGTWFRLDLEYELPKGKLIDYVEICTSLHREMNNTQLYLETVVENLGHTLIKEFPFFQSLSIKISKECPPIKGLEKGAFCVEFNMIKH